MKKLSIHLLVILMIFSCARQESESTCFNYPSQLDSLQVRDLYDTARWYLYAWLCDRQHDGVYQGECEMRYTSFFLQNDSIELFFTLHFPHDDENSEERQRVSSRPSFGFNFKTREKLWGWDINGFSDELGPGDIRFENPRPPEVVSFIKDHKDSLNPCFLELAKRMNAVDH